MTTLLMQKLKTIMIENVKNRKDILKCLKEVKEVYSSRIKLGTGSFLLKKNYKSLIDECWKGIVGYK